MAVMRPLSREMYQLINEMERAFEPFWSIPRGECSETAPKKWVPAIDVIEEEDHLNIRVALPGFNRENIEIEVEDNILRIAGKSQFKEKEATSSSKTATYHRQEIMTDHFSRSLALPLEVDGDQAEASFQEGILLISLPKSKEQQKRRIPIH